MLVLYLSVGDVRGIESPIIFHSFIQGGTAMPFAIIHFRGSDQILKKKRMINDVTTTLDYIDTALSGVLNKREILRQVLDEMGWLGENGCRRFLAGRRYEYKGFKKGIALEGNFAAYEFILEGLLRLQIGFDKGMIETGVLMLNAHRSEKTPYGSTAQMVKEEIELLHPTISLPVSIALFELDPPMLEELDMEGEPDTEERDYFDSGPVEFVDIAS
jgi:hypothetical protein